MEMIKEILYVLFNMSIIASLTGIITLLIKRLLKYKISPKWLILIWSVFLITLINPFKIQSNFSVYNIISFDKLMADNTNLINKEALDKHTNISDHYDEFLYNSLENIEEDSAVDSNNIRIIQMAKSKFINTARTMLLMIINNWERIFEISSFIYINVVLIKIIISILTYNNVSQNIKTEFKNGRLKNILGLAKKKANIEKEIRLVKQNFIETPAIYGVFKSKILLKEDILNMSDEEIELILMHELSHMKNGDVILNSLIQVLKIVYWFNPLIIHFLNILKKDIELSNDERVIDDIEESKVNTYCKTLLKVSLFSNRDSCVALGISGNAKDLEVRIKMIKEKNHFLRNKTLIVITILVVILSITACFATTGLKSKNYNSDSLLNTVVSSEISEKLTTLIENEIQTGLKNTIFPIEGEYTITSGYGKRMHPVTKDYFVHNGIDIARSGISGDKVMTIANGVVQYVGYDPSNGNAVEIKHIDEETGEELYTYYAHLSSIEVEKGEYVKQGEKIGCVGSTGLSTGPHLHFEIRDLEKNSVDPSKYVEIQ